MRWTSEQLEAIQAEGNVIVSAAAGAGKTAVLTERVVSRVASGSPIDSMLVLTFTRAAASEMKSRITNRLNQLADQEADPEQMRFLRRQARNVESAYISTIHAFCARVLRRHYHAVGLPAQSRTADEMESAALMETVRDELLTELSVGADADYHTLLAAFGGEQQAWDAVMQTFRFTRAQADPSAWLDAASASYQSESALNYLLDDAVAYCKHETTLMLEPILRARDMLPPDWASVISVLDGDLSRYRALALCKTYDEYREALDSIEYETMRFPKGTTDGEKDPIKDARQLGKDLIKAQKDRFLRTRAEALGALRRSGEAVAALTGVVKKLEQAYTKAKREANLQDYDDLEHLTLEALKQDAIAAEYCERFLWIAVDEYQDSNRVQEAILRRIARGDNLFFVGDVKQSIYRFRQAEPGLFLEKLNLFSAGAGSRVDLTQNFRSSPEVLACVNETFAAILSTEAGDMEYDSRARLACGATPPAGGAELHLIRKSRAESETEEDALADAADMEVESRLIADQIRKIMQSESYEDTKNNQNRPYRYADFAVLLRAGTDAQVAAQTLAQCGVPCYAQSSGGYFDAVEVQIFRNLLRVIDNLRQDVPLISVLCSSIGGFSFEELAEIRASHRTGSFYEAFMACAGREDVLGGRAKAFTERMQHYREESRLISVEELAGLLLDETGFYEEMGAGQNGAQRQANLNALLDKAHVFEQSGSRGVWNFLRQLDLAESTASVGAAQTVTADVVRILTIHKSKGLEFPVVFVAGLGKKMNLQDARNTLQLHASGGVALRFVDRGEDGVSRIKRDTIARQILSQRVRTEQVGEEMRVLYVAMTRAERRLILTACLTNPEAKLEAAPERPAAWNVLKSSSPVQWLMMGPRRAIRVSVHDREAWLSSAEKQASQELPPFDPIVLEAIEAKLDWKYEFPQAVKLGAKASVSRIGRDESYLPDFRLPAFIGAAKSAAFTGTATHAAMQYLPKEGIPTADALATYFDRLVETGRLTGEQAEAADQNAVLWFAQSPLFVRMRQSARLERELAFSYAMDASALFEIDSGERVLLQGVMDACFVENGAWVIVDYKTDRVRPEESAEQAAQKHALQLSLYATSLEALTKLPVKEKLVVMLSHRAVISL
ncbi:MAG TPA: UvrD-helicase domain-containing protein [Feifaniaceae bacterium]|nr:UvrD-helicase domain-containing protein [Feifaniaceae bacterium]